MENTNKITNLFGGMLLGTAMLLMTSTAMAGNFNLTMDVEGESVSGRKAVALKGEDVNFSIDPDKNLDTVSWDFGTGATPSTASGYGPHAVSYGSAAEGGESDVQISADRTDDEGNNCSTPMKKTASVVVPKLEVKEVSFSGDGNYRIKDIQGTFASESGQEIQSPEWKDAGTPQAICYKKESSPTLKVKFSIIPSLGSSSKSVKIKAEGKQGSTTLTYPEKDLTLTGSEVELNELTTSSNLGNAIDNTDYKVTWQLIKANDDTEDIKTTSNKLFVVLGQPSGVLSYIRLNAVTSSAKGSDDNQKAIRNLWLNDFAYVPYNIDSRPNNVWSILDGVPGSCYHISQLFSQGVGLLGVNAQTSIVYVYVNTNGGVFESPLTGVYKKRNCEPNNNGHESDSIHHIFGNVNEKLNFKDGGGKINNYEACFVYNGGYYAPGTAIRNSMPAKIFSSNAAVMTAIAQESLWAICDQQEVGLYICSQPGPYPEHNW
ncbi:MAG: hypothetical protein LBH01_01185 [Verrucomicrobiales bacterium]|jgi:hypothetical protein|nr:hypothetical protein [Verrucomicrobiales bacterium]